MVFVEVQAAVANFIAISVNDVANKFMVNVGRDSNGSLKKKRVRSVMNSLLQVNFLPFLKCTVVLKSKPLSQLAFIS